jgi:hypothetical protein
MKRNTRLRIDMLHQELAENYGEDDREEAILFYGFCKGIWYTLLCGGLCVGATVLIKKVIN